jgi:integrase/recombinase XerD
LPSTRTTPGLIRPLGTDATEAYNKRIKKQAELNALSHGLVLEAPTNGSESLDGAIEEFLTDTKTTKKHKTYAAYKVSLEYFRESCSKQFVEQIDRRDMLRFIGFLREEKGLSPRSVYNKFEVVVTWLKANGVRGLVMKHDWPRFVEQEPEIYEKEDLDKFFAACNDEERLWFEFFLMTGMREQEVMHCYWSDIKFAHSTVRVTHKPDRGWTPKAYKEREIPVPEKLTSSLKSWKACCDGSCNMVFPTSGCNPKFDFLDCCKAIAKRAGLNADTFWLHKFRATFATWHLWAGVDLRTVQLWLGHSDLESTMRYLKPSREAKARQKVNETFA